MTKKEIIETAHAFLEYENDLFLNKEFISLSKRANDLGIFLNEDKEEIENFCGEVHIPFLGNIGNDYSVAITLGAFILFDKTVLSLKENEVSAVTTFAVVLLIPNLEEYVDVSNKVIINTARNTGIPYQALRLALT